jgi:hypothetical protein
MDEVLENNQDMFELDLPPIRVAFVLDDKVEEILFVDNRLGAILLSDPLILEVVEERATTDFVAIGDSYDPENDKFFRTTVVRPEPIEEYTSE